MRRAQTRGLLRVKKKWFLFCFFFVFRFFSLFSHQHFCPSAAVSLYERSLPSPPVFSVSLLFLFFCNVIITKSWCFCFSFHVVVGVVACSFSLSFHFPFPLPTF